MLTPKNGLKVTTKIFGDIRSKVEMRKQQVLRVLSKSSHVIGLSSPEEEISSPIMLKQGKSIVEVVERTL